MNRKIKRAAVLGSGVMGAGIAAHLANIGIPVLMLDVTPRELNDREKKQGKTLEDKEVRNRISSMNKEALKKQKPSPITSKASLNLIEVGNMSDDMEKLSEVDWIIEVVVENLEVKKKVLAEVDQHRKNGAIVSSNTSGISIEAMSAECSEDFQKHFLGTHFFNPPRYLKLLEIIPTKDTDPEVLEFIKTFGEDVLGKGVVEAKDTPNFIANRIGTYGLLVTVQKMLEKGYSVGEVDSVTGPMIGRPKSATFRTLDVVGLDTFIHVANNVHDQVVEGEEKEAFEIPEFMNQMLEKGWLGSKSGQGFFLKQKSKDGSEILQLNPETMEYEKRGKLNTKATEMAKQEKGSGRKLKALINAKGDPAGDLIWSIVKPVLLYSAELYGEIADDVPSIDEAMRWGFGWEMGPFEMWDAIGVQASVTRMKEDGENIPAWIEDMLNKGFGSFYKTENGNVYFYHNAEYKQQTFNKKNINLKRVKETKDVIKKNAGASLIDIGDDVACLEFHSQSNAIGLDIIQMINFAIDHVDEHYKGLVIGNQGKNFCVGANLGMMLMEAQDYNFFEIEMVVKNFQDALMKVKYSDKPVVSAPFGMTLGGGAEVCLPSDAVQASPETYMGLVEPGVGLIPGGGGNKELYMKHLRNIPEGVDFDLQKVANNVFEKIAMAKVSTSAEEARENGFLDQMDAISANGDHLLHDAKQKVIGLADSGYTAPKRTKIPVVGEQGYATMLLGAKSLLLSGYASEHDLKIAEKLAFVLAGGRLKEGSLVDEQYLLDLEREAFLSLIGEPKTQARMQHMLMKGKPLRN